MIDLLDENDAKAAADQGWQLAYVHDLATRRWIIEVIPTARSGFNSAFRAQVFVMARARSGDALAERAMRTVLAGVQKTSKRK